MNRNLPGRLRALILAVPAALADAIAPDDFAVRIPSSVLCRRTAVSARFERLLIGRHLATSSRNLALVRGLRGARVNLAAPKPLSVQYVGIQFDRYLTIPGS